MSNFMETVKIYLRFYSNCKILWKGFVIFNKIQIFFTFTVKSQKILTVSIRFYIFHIFCNTVYGNCITDSVLQYGNCNTETVNYR